MHKFYTFNPYTPEVVITFWSRSGQKISKLPLIGAKNKGIRFTNMSICKGKEKICDIVDSGNNLCEIAIQEYDANDDFDVECGDFGNEDGEEHGEGVDDMDFWDGLLGGDEDLLDVVVATYSQGKASQPASETITEPVRELVREPVRDQIVVKDWDSNLSNSDELLSPRATTDEERDPNPRSIEFNVVDIKGIVRIH